MALYEVRVTRTVHEEHADIIVRARSEREAREKALAEVKKNKDKWFDSLDEVLSAGGADKIDFVPDCEVVR